jgi:hypothetical protein
LHKSTLAFKGAGLGLGLMVYGLNPKPMQTKGFPGFQMQTIEVHFETDIMVQTKLFCLQCPTKATRS